jgi:hypothetical protein
MTKLMDQIAEKIAAAASQTEYDECSMPPDYKPECCYWHIDYSLAKDFGFNEEWNELLLTTKNYNQDKVKGAGVRAIEKINQALGEAHWDIKMRVEQGFTSITVNKWYLVLPVQDLFNPEPTELAFKLRVLGLMEKMRSE